MVSALCKNHSGDKRVWTAAETWHWRDEEWTLVKVHPKCQLRVQDPHAMKLKLVTMNRAYRSLLANVKPICSGRSQHIGDFSTIG